MSVALQHRRGLEPVEVAGGAGQGPGLQADRFHQLADVLQGHPTEALLAVFEGEAEAVERHREPLQLAEPPQTDQRRGGATLHAGADTTGRGAVSDRKAEGGGIGRIGQGRGFRNGGATRLSIAVATTV